MTVYHQQLMLELLGYSPGKLDGIAGKQTENAIREFQRDNGLPADGLWGPQTEKMARNNIAVGTLRKTPVETPTPAATPTVSKTTTGTFWDDIQYFSRNEFKCPCPRCGGFPVEPVEKLVRIADRVRAQAGNKAHVSSGVRCVAHNAELPGSASNSRHLKGWAMDFRIDGLTSSQLLALVQAQSGVAYSYKIDDRYVHMDVIL